jgi:hypothetical protein
MVQWRPVRFYTPSLTVPAGRSIVTPLHNGSVLAEARTYNSTQPLLHINTTETVTIREYLCGRYISLIRDGTDLQFRWMQRYRTNAVDNVATWYLDDIRIRVWTGECFVPVLVENFDTPDSTMNTADPGISYRSAAANITRNTCAQDSSSGGSNALWFNERNPTTGAFRRLLIIRIEGFSLGSCTASNATISELYRN